MVSRPLRNRFSLKILFVLLASVASPVFAAKKPVTIDALVNAHASSAGHATGQITWAPDGNRFVFSDEGKLFLYDVPTGKQREVVEFAVLDRTAVAAPPSTGFDWTNRRVNENDVQWFADGKRLLVSASGDLFVVDVAKGSFMALTQTAEGERDPKLSPDNQFVSFRRGHDLWVAEVATKQATRLTADGSDTLLNAELDWVYPEELELDTAHWWSPDSQSIAYLQFDVAREPIFPQVNLLNARGVAEPERYPKAGDPNAEVRLGIVPVKGGATRWMELGDPRDGLLARVAWSLDSREVLAERLNRVQNQLDLLLADAATGAVRPVLHEEDKYWINVSDGPRFVDNGRFLWSSERGGFRHLYLYRKDGTLEKQLTAGDWEVSSVAEVANGRVLFTSTESGPLERQLYEVDFAGNRRRLSQGSGTHAVSVSPGTAYYVDDFSGLGELPRSTLYKGDGSLARVFRKPEPALSEEYEILPTEIVPVKAADGTTLYARLIWPAGFEQGKKYPAVVMVYGGPGIQKIHNSWQGLSWDQVLAHKGFAIWQMDNRGSTGRGHGFESVIFRDMGAQELEDQRAGIDALLAMGFVDSKRIGMYGWSYGGYMTLFTATHAPGLLKAAIAGAPVTDWHNYDSIYTERYMGLPAENAEAYRKSSPQTAASGLAGTRLLILHNFEDDNVHFQNSVQMADALEKAGKKFHMVVYPQRSHGVSGLARRQPSVPT
jgi:dipeptidyl-peptidase-4